MCFSCTLYIGGSEIYIGTGIDGSAVASIGGNGGGAAGVAGTYSGNQDSGSSGGGGSSYLGTLTGGSTSAGVCSGLGQIVFSFQTKYGNFALRDCTIQYKKECFPFTVSEEEAKDEGGGGGVGGCVLMSLSWSCWE